MCNIPKITLFSHFERSGEIFRVDSQSSREGFNIGGFEKDGSKEGI